MGARNMKAINRFLPKGKREFSTFDEHINYLVRQIVDNKECIRECNEEIEEWQKEIEEVKAAKKAAEENPLEHVPTIWLGGWEDTDAKKQEVYEWCQAHEIKYHPEVVGNFYEENCKMPNHKKPNYDFITASSSTSSIRYVRCVDCYEKWIREGKPSLKDPDAFERYLKN